MSKTVRYLSLSELAERVGISVNTAKSYRAKRLLPTPDAITGTMRGRLPGTVDQWQANRPGRGARTDLKRHD